MIESEDQKTQLSSPLIKKNGSHPGDLSLEKDFKPFNSYPKLRHIETFVSMRSIKTKLFTDSKASTYSSQTYSRRELSRLKSNPQSGSSVDLEQKEKQTTIEQIINKSLKLLNEFFSNQMDLSHINISQANKLKLISFNQNFREGVRKVLKQIKYKPKEVVNHFNSIYFSSPSIRVLDFGQIQKQILKQWRQNILLTSIRYEWFNCIQQYLPNFGNQAYKIFSQVLLQQFCDFLSYITYSVFKLYFIVQVEKQNKSTDKIISKISNQTMRYIITQSSQWQNMICILMDQIMRIDMKKVQISQFNKHYLTFMVINQMKMQPLRALLDSLYKNNTELFPQTKISLLKFIKQRFSLSKVKSIINIRVCLEQDILTYQKQLINKMQIQEFQMFEKDGMLTCLIIAVLSLLDKKTVSLQALQLSIKQIRTLFGENLQTVLGIHKCPSYFADLQAALDFIYFQMQNISKNNNP